MSRIIRLGDPHVKVSNLAESEALLEFVRTTAKAIGVDRVEILGDLFDTHAIVRLEVLEFWEKWLKAFSTESFETIVLVGNHDVSGIYSNSFSALSVFGLIGGSLNIIERPTLIGNIGYLPYIHENDDFVTSANQLAEQGATVLVSHTTYDGCAFDNGMFAPNGVNPDLIRDSVKHLISGHIHTKQEFGRVIYPGTARWAGASDANREKGLYIYDHAASGAIVDVEFISTASVCKPIIGIELKEGSSELPVLPENANVLLSLVGSSAWVAKMKDEYRGRCSISSKITDSKKSASRKSGKSLMEFISNHYETKKRERLISFMQELKLV